MRPTTNILYLQNGFLDDGQAFNFGAALAAGAYFPAV
jgi:hypothetical protein